MTGYEGCVCETKNCGKGAQLRCPTCVKLNLTDSYFCSQVIVFFVGFLSKILWNFYFLKFKHLQIIFRIVLKAIGAHTNWFIV